MGCSFHTFVKSLDSGKSEVAHALNAAADAKLVSAAYVALLAL